VSTYTEMARSRLAEKTDEMKSILDLAQAEKRDITPTENKRLKTLEYEAAERATVYERAKRADELAKEAAEFRGVTTRIESSTGAPSVHPDAPISSRLFNVTSDVELRALLTSTSSNAIATTQNWPDFSAYLANQSAALQAGCRIIDIDATSVKIPAGTALATGAWLAEGGTASASEMGVRAFTITPARLTVFSEVSNEVLEDASFPALEEISSHMFASLGELLDEAVFEGTGSNNQPQGMRNLAGSSTASSGGTAVDLSYFVNTFETSLASGAPVQAWTTNAAAWGAYASLKIGGTASYDLRPLLQLDAEAGGAAIAGRVLGKPLYTTENVDALGAGTAAVYGYDPSQVWIVRRRQFRMIADPFSKAEQGIVRFVLEGRFGVAFPQPSAINVFTVLTP
jgi:HK97 family phage major capsid protein